MLISIFIIDSSLNIFCSNHALENQTEPEYISSGHLEKETSVLNGITHLFNSLAASW